MERICKVIEDALGNEVGRDFGRNMGSKVRKLSHRVPLGHSLSTSSRIRKVNHERLIVLIVLGSSTLG